MDSLRSTTSKNGRAAMLILFTIAFTNFLDYLLLTAVVPVIPDFLVDEDERSEEDYILTSSNMTWISLTDNDTDILGLWNSSFMINATGSHEPDFIEKALHIPIRAISENSRVGWLLSSKALLQIIANPVVGYLSNRVSYKYLLMFGTSVFLLSSSAFAVGQSYVPLLVARALQGIGSACTSIAGMSMLASRYHDDTERSRAMGVAMGGCAVGILGYPFGGLLYAAAGKLLPFVGIAIFCVVTIALQNSVLDHNPIEGSRKTEDTSSLRRLLYDPYILLCAGAIMVTSMSLAVLESTVPLWVMDTMDASQWQLGLIFIPDSLGYFLGTNGFPVIAKTYGRWIFTTGSMFLIATGLIIIPFCKTIGQLLVPHLCLGIGVGVTDAAIMPLLALLVDQKHTATYGTVYAIVQLSVCLAYSLGPAIAGLVVKNEGFEWSMWGMAILNGVFLPFCVLLRSPPACEETQCILDDVDTIDNVEEDRKHSYNAVK